MKKLVILLFLGIFAISFGASAQTSSTTAVADTTVFKDFVGKYKFKEAPFEEIIVSSVGGKLYGEAVGQGTAELKATNEVDIYEVVGFDGKTKFVRDAATRAVIKCELSIQGQTLIGEKQQ